MPGLAARIAPATSPSEISRTRAPSRRTRSIASAVPVAVEDRHGQVSDLHPARRGDVAQVVLDRGRDVDRPAPPRPHGDLLHVDARARVEHRAAAGDRDHRQGVGLAPRDQAGAVDRVDRHVDGGRAAGAEVLAVVEHRRLVLLPLADHDDAVEVDRVEHQAHRVDGGPVGGVLVAPADPARGRQRGGLGGADQVEGEVPVGDRLPSSGHRHPRVLGGMTTEITFGEGRLSVAPETPG